MRIYNHARNEREGFFMSGKFSENLREWRKDRSLARLGAGLAAALALLLVCLCISIVMQSNIQHRYASAVDRIQEQTFQGLISMTELFSRVEEPGVDVQNKLIPALNAQYTAVSALNTALAENFGASRAVLTPEQTAAFDTAFAEYSDAYRQGLETGLARADMTAILEQVQAMIDKRYAPKVKPTATVPVIDASSGEIAKGE